MESMITNLKLTEPKNVGSYITRNVGSSQILPKKNLALEKNLNTFRKSKPYKITYLKDSFSDELWQAMKHRGMSQVRFAKKAKVSKQFLTKVFRGGNCTIETMVSLAFALDYDVNIHLTPQQMECSWIHALSQPSPSTANWFYLWNGQRYQQLTVLKEEIKRDTVASVS